jgi:hypothetical protein
MASMLLASVDRMPSPSRFAEVVLREADTVFTPLLTMIRCRLLGACPQLLCIASCTYNAD